MPTMVAFSLSIEPLYFWSGGTLDRKRSVLLSYGFKPELCQDYSIASRSADKAGGQRRINSLHLYLMGMHNPPRLLVCLTEKSQQYMQA
jgi:hypothetical protein